MNSNSQSPNAHELSENNGEINSTADTVVLDMEVRLREEMQNKKLDTDEVRNAKDTALSKNEYANDLLVRYKQTKNPAYGQVIWVQYSGDDYGGTPLDYSPENRNGFVLLVLSIVFVMLLLTAAFNIVVLSVESLKDIFLSMGYILVLPPMLIMIGLNYAVACSPCSRRPPMNIIILIIAVICMSIITAFFTTRYNTSTIFYALIATVLTVFVCMCLACSSFDFTKYILFVVVISAALAGIGLMVFLGMLISGTYLKPVHLGLLIVGTLLQVIVLTIELQTILGGRTVELSEDEYAFGAFLVYTSIVDIFIKMVQMIGMFQD